MVEATKKILILSRTDDRVEYDTQQSMVRQLQQVSGEDALYTGANFEDLLFHFDGSQLTIVDSATGSDVASYDFVFFIGWFKTPPLEDVAMSVAKYLEWHSVPFYNTEVLYTRSRSKISQYVIAALNDIAITPFLFAMNQELLIGQIKERGFYNPYIAKRINASRGEDNYVFQTSDDLDLVLRKTVSEKPLYFVAQEFIPNDGDYRIIVVGGSVRMVIHRKAAEGTHLSNTSKGGSAELIDPTTLPPQMIEDSVRIATLVKREITGVDMIVHQETGKYYMLEVNNMPQLSTGSYVTKKAEMLSDFFQNTAK